MSKKNRSIVEDEISTMQKSVELEAEIETKKEVSEEKIQEVQKEEILEDKVVKTEEYDVMPLMSATDRILKTVKGFGRCRVVVDELKVLTRSRFLREYKESALKRGDTFYFDRIHTTTKNYQYVSWDAGNGKRSYALFKNLDTDVSPVIKIEA